MPPVPPGLLILMIWPVRPMHIEMTCAFAAGEILAISIAAADAPTSQRHVFLKD
jgi:hypothetical protein